MAVLHHETKYTQELNITSITPLLYVIDMVNGFCKEGAMADPKILDIVPCIAKLCEYLPENRRFFVADHHEEGDEEFQSFPPHCLAGTAESEVIEELQSYNKSRLIEKNSTNAFHALSELDFQTLAGRDTDAIILTGCCTDICVLQFALSLKTYLNAHAIHKQVIVPVDCVETYDMDQLHPAADYNEMALALMANAGIEVVKTIHY